MKRLVAVSVFVCFWLVTNAQFNPNCYGTRNTIVHLFEWRWADIAEECERFLAPKGFCGVQISPPNEHIVIMKDVEKQPWWQRYQPVSYKTISRSGNEQAFINMVNRCNNVGVRIYVDAVINHMTGAGAGEGTGIGGSAYNASGPSFPAVPYSSQDFNQQGQDCFTASGNIENFVDDVNEVRNCRLVGLTDLKQGKTYVRQKISEWLNSLVSIGVAGFRFDAAKHVWPADLKSIINSLYTLPTRWFSAGAKPFVYQEVIDFGGEPIKSSDYYGMARVTEFNYGKYVSEAFQNKVPLKNFKNFGEGWGYLMPDSKALVFVDNHDNQRGHGSGGDILTFFKPRQYKMAVTFMLAWPYGVARVMSSYYWDRNFVDGKDQNDWVGPPSDANYNTKPVTINADGSCGNGWVCEHRWKPITHMAHFRSVADTEPVQDWWDDGEYQIAFSRGSRAFYAVNAGSHLMHVTLQTGLRTGYYCDVISGERSADGNSCTGKVIAVGSGGRAVIEIQHSAEEPMIAIHLDSKANISAEVGEVTDVPTLSPPKTTTRAVTTVLSTADDGTSTKPMQSTTSNDGSVTGSPQSTSTDDDSVTDTPQPTPTNDGSSTTSPQSSTSNHDGSVSGGPLSTSSNGGISTDIPQSTSSNDGSVTGSPQSTSSDDGSVTDSVTNDGSTTKPLPSTTMNDGALGSSTLSPSTDQGSVSDDPTSTLPNGGSSTKSPQPTTSEDDGSVTGAPQPTPTNDGSSAQSPQSTTSNDDGSVTDSSSQSPSTDNVSVTDAPQPTPTNDGSTTDLLLPTGATNDGSITASSQKTSSDHGSVTDVPDSTSSNGGSTTIPQQSTTSNDDASVTDGSSQSPSTDDSSVSDAPQSTSSNDGSSTDSPLPTTSDDGSVSDGSSSHATSTDESSVTGAPQLTSTNDGSTTTPPQYSSTDDWSSSPLTTVDFSSSETEPITASIPVLPTSTPSDSSSSYSTETGSPGTTNSKTSSSSSASEGDITSSTISTDDGSQSTKTATTMTTTRTTPADYRRTVVMIKKQTNVGQDVFLRGGNIPACNQNSSACQIPIIYTSDSYSPSYNVWKVGDTRLDWIGAEDGQGVVNGTKLADGSPMWWSTNSPVSEAYSPLNTYGEHYWLWDVEIDCLFTDNGWFDLKGFLRVTTNPADDYKNWETLKDSNKPTCIGDYSTPYTSFNHVARCGAKNVFIWGDNTKCEIFNLTS